MPTSNLATTTKYQDIGSFYIIADNSLVDKTGARILELQPQTDSEGGYYKIDVLIHKTDPNQSKIRVQKHKHNKTLKDGYITYETNSIEGPQEAKVFAQNVENEAMIDAEVQLGRAAVTQQTRQFTRNETHYTQVHHIHQQKRHPR